MARLIEAVGLADRKGHRPAELSGGQQQRVAVARALVSKPAVVFADEPTGNLDSKTSDEVLALLRQSADEFGQTIVMVTHDPHAATIADRILFLQDGVIVLDSGKMGRDEIYDVVKSLEADGGAGGGEGAAMIRIALRSLWSRKLRTVLTMLAILLGVAMISGTYVLTDQINKGFDDIFKKSVQGTDVNVTYKAAFTGANYFGPTGTLPASLLAVVQTTPGVAEAAGQVGASGAVVIDGKTVTTGGAPTLVYSTTPRSLQFEHLRVRRAADQRRLRSRSTRSCAGQEPQGRRPHRRWPRRTGVQDVTVSGVFNFGDATSIGGATMVQTTLADVQGWYDMVGKLSSIAVAARSGVTPEQLATPPEGALPAYAEVKTGEQTAADASKAVSDALGSVLTPALLAFGGVAVIVGAFIIFNAFSITVAQRHARVRHAALAGRHSPAGLADSARRGARHGRGRLGRRPRRRAGRGQGHQRAVQGRRRRHPDRRHRRSSRGPSSSPWPSASASPSSPPGAGAARDARAAGRRPAGGRHAAAESLHRRHSSSSPWRRSAGACSRSRGLVRRATTTSLLVLGLGGGASCIFVAVAMVAKYVVRPVAGVVGWPLDEAGAHQRPPGARERRPQPGAHRRHRRGAHDRARRRRLRRRVRPRPEELVRRRARPSRAARPIVISGQNGAHRASQDRRRGAAVPGVEDAAGIASATVQVNGDGTASMDAVEPGDVRADVALRLAQGRQRRAAGPARRRRCPRRGAVRARATSSSPVRRSRR